MCNNLVIKENVINFFSILALLAGQLLGLRGPDLKTPELGHECSVAELKDLQPLIDETHKIGWSASLQSDVHLSINIFKTTNAIPPISIIVYLYGQT